MLKTQSHSKQVFDIISDCIQQLVQQVGRQLIQDEGYQLKFLKLYTPYLIHRLSHKPLLTKSMRNFYVVLIILLGLVESPATLTEEKLQVLSAIPSTEILRVLTSQKNGYFAKLKDCLSFRMKKCIFNGVSVLAILNLSQELTDWERLFGSYTYAFDHDLYYL